MTEYISTIIGILVGTCTLLGIGLKILYSYMLERMEFMVDMKIEQYERNNERIRTERQKSYQFKIEQMVSNSEEQKKDLKELLNMVSSFGNQQAGHEARIKNLEEFCRNK